MDIVDAPVVETPEKIAIGDAEYTPEEAQELIGLAKKTRELEQRYNTKFDSVWPEYGRLSTEHKTLKTQYEQAQQEIAKFKQDNPGEKVPNDLQVDLEKARKLGFTFKDDLEKEGYLRKDDLGKWYQEQRAQERAVEKIQSEAESLAKEIDGKDGRPRFNKMAVLAFAQATGVSDLKKAYENMYSEELKEWGEREVKTVQKPGFKTLSPQKGTKQPNEGKTTSTNLRDRIAESLWKE